jgi:hypothetical protein
MLRTAPLLSALFSTSFIALAFHTSANAAIVANYNFDSVAIGATPPTTAPGVDALPQSQLYSIGGFPDTPPFTGTVTVQDVGSLSHAAVMTTTQGGIGAQYLDTQFLVATNYASISFDINVIDVPTSGVPQAGGGAPNGQAFAMNLFGLDSQRVFRFAVAPTNATGGSFGIRLPGAAGDLFDFATYTEGTAYHLEFQNDFLAGTTSIYLNNSFVGSSPTVLPATGISELFMFQNGVEGQTNSVALDNIVISTDRRTAAVPEGGSTVALFGIGLLGLGLMKLRKNSSDNAQG